MLDKKEELLTAKEGSLLLKYILPSVGGMLGLSLCILCDAMFIGQKFGALGVAALNITYPVYSLMTALYLMLGVGGATLIGIYMGQKNYKSINKIFTTSIIGIIVLYIFFLIARTFFMDDIVSIIGASEKTFAYTKSYLDVIMIFSGPYMILGAMNVFIRNDSNPKLAMMSVIMTNIVNIVLDYVFLFICGYGIWGVALATSLGQIAGLIVLSAHFIKKKNTFHFHTKSFDFKFLFKISKIGIPSFISSLTTGVVIIAFNFVSYNLLGNVGLSAYGVVNNIAVSFLAIFSGLAQGVQPLVSINFGAKNHNRVVRFIKLSRVIAFLVGASMFIIAFLFPVQIIHIFATGDALFMHQATVGMIIYFASFMLAGVNVLNIAAIQAIGEFKISTTLSLLRGFVYMLIFLFILSKSFGMMGLWVTMPVVEIATSLSLIGIEIYLKKVKQTRIFG
ncbi:MATE family efflux transporter [uncultured Clostridium sp.]|uniref:MATE family efflux transporter n=1 Tax=uncultured Clostridium sp. TaxID=59620 RepID=UPI00262F1074|nr:MATE family efflux transporter [uncultured Clostridium sp.]